MKKGVIKKIFLCLTFLFLIGLVSAWSVDITKLNNNAPTNYYNTGVNSFSYSVTDLNCPSNYSWIKYSLNGQSNQPLSCGNGESTFFPLSWIEGNNTLEIYVNDTAGTINSDSVSFWVDSISPILNYVIPSANLAYTNLDTLSFQFWLNETNKRDYHPGPQFVPFSLFLYDPYSFLFSSPSLTNLSSGDEIFSEIKNEIIPGGNLYEGSYKYIVYSSDIYPSGSTIREINISGTIIRDITAPTLTLNGADPITLEALSDSYIEFGATATDNLDPLINSNIIIDSSAVDTTTLGTYTVTYDVQDQAGNVATQITRTVNVVDTTAPIITLIGSDPINIEVFTPYGDAGAKALDNYDGDITGNIVTANPVNTNPLGTYIVTYDVMDSSGNPATQITRTVNVVDTTAPIITLVGSDPINIEVFTPYGDSGATALDNYDGDITGNIVTANPVDTNIIGTYFVTYDVMDSSGNPATQITRTVNVVDTTAPIITLVGS